MIVGTGLAGPAHTSAGAMAAILNADVVYFLVSDALTRHWLTAKRPDALDLGKEYAVGRKRTETYRAIVESLLAPLREGKRVCGAFYGHPGVFAFPTHEAIRIARSEGIEARMLPGISAEDCLFADLGIDPGTRGCQSFEATDFLVRRRRFDPTAGLVLWQSGAIGVEDHRDERLWNREGLSVLAEVLLETYPLEHPILIYEASSLPITGPRIAVTPVHKLADAAVTAISTLWIEPLPDRGPDREMLRRLGLGG